MYGRNLTNVTGPVKTEHVGTNHTSSHNGIFFSTGTEYSTCKTLGFFTAIVDQQKKL